MNNLEHISKLIQSRNYLINYTKIWLKDNLVAIGYKSTNYHTIEDFTAYYESIVDLFLKRKIYYQCTPEVQVLIKPVTDEEYSNYLKILEL